jgi:uncharacterized membrane protein YkvA (DUF1232 family)
MALPRLIGSALNSFKRAWPLMRDERVPRGLKIVAVVFALLIISPLDVFADIPVLGFLDDAALLSLLCMLFVWLAQSSLDRDMKNVTPSLERRRRDISGPPAVR